MSAARPANSVESADFLSCKSILPIASLPGRARPPTRCATGCGCRSRPHGSTASLRAQLVFACAAAITLGRFMILISELYKVGEDPRWVESLNLLESFGLDLAIVAHGDNVTGRNHDTRICFMGEPRMKILERLLPSSTVILGVEQTTACTIDLRAAELTVAGVGARNAPAVDTGAVVDPYVELLIGLRAKSLRPRQWAPADEARDGLARSGVALEARSGGTTWRRV